MLKGLFRRGKWKSTLLVLLVGVVFSRVIYGWLSKLSPQLASKLQEVGDKAAENAENTNPQTATE